jgi:hypothetical protein
MSAASRALVIGGRANVTGRSSRGGYNLSAIGIGLSDHTRSGVKEPGRVTKLLKEFQSEIETSCGQLINHEFETS